MQQFHLWLYAKNPLKAGTLTDLYIHVHSSSFHSSQKMDLIQVSITRWRDKQMWSIYTVECYSDLKRAEILTYATTWMNFEDIMLSEISPFQKDKYCMIRLI